eukprot:CAMPEP_0170528282 /NCGR_PEP_ID=MMETSP0209-20121228/13781_1 /TAXON_ID=665100 ORGANISM="Litonotus pictus, Strain P1" /NCGR_SAMPLE_ID=MMETSP0209 /ASSEMBLY_ACC=CAM_ASM_000301 /LENGTH=363 /DNA_ID=CAMNT_0010819395 /DNA_START=224 /DNA_END=1315 /DNA_ORIENTATION=+
MKRFLNESEGVPYGSPKYLHLRRKYYQEVYAEEKAERKNGEEIIQTGGNQGYFLKFYFIVVPEDLNNFKLLSLLNFNHMMYKAFEDCPKTKQITQNFLGYEYRKTYKSIKFPFMQMECSEDMPQKVEDYDQVIAFLVENKFLNEFRTFSAYEAKGLELFEEIKVLMETLFLRPSNKFSFYLRHVNFQECFYGYNPKEWGFTYAKRIANKLGRCMKLILKDYFTYRSKKKLFPEIEKEIKLKMNQWSESLNQQPFHGGDFPDDADFSVLSLFQKYMQCYRIEATVKIILKENRVLQDWLDKMKMLSTRSSFFNTADFTYVYNPLLGEKIIDEIEIEGNRKKKAKKFNTDLKGAFLSNRRSTLNI